MSRTVGNHLASRLVEIGLHDWFGVPGKCPLTFETQLLLWVFVVLDMILFRS
jgi:TPP-dependent 2-oxoacid decarboxylase